MCVKNIVPVNMRSEIDCAQGIIITPGVSTDENINRLQSGLNLRRAPYSLNQLNYLLRVFHLKK